MNSKTQIAYLAIKNKIITGELAPRSDIAEEDLQQELGCSRTPIREALQTLQKEGFVTVYPRKGVIVTDVSIDLLNEIYDIRALHEPYIAQKALGRISNSFLLELKERFLRPPECSSLEALSAYYADLDTIFHVSQLDYCGNRFVEDTMRVVDDHEKRIRRLTFNVQNNDNFCISEHVEMIECFLAKDLDRLLIAVSEHVRRARQLVFSSLYNISPSPNEYPIEKASTVSKAIYLR